MEPVDWSTCTCSTIMTSKHKIWEFIIDDLAQDTSIQTRDGFQDPSARITFGLVEAMDILCRNNEEDPPRSYWLTGSLHMALLLFLTGSLVELSFNIFTLEEVDG